MFQKVGFAEVGSRQIALGSLVIQSVGKEQLKCFLLFLIMTLIP
jgi:hypothetical protein